MPQKAVKNDQAASDIAIRRVRLVRSASAAIGIPAVT